jgi:hypothetical protein
MAKSRRLASALTSASAGRREAQQNRLTRAAIAAVPVAIVSPRVCAATALLCVAFFLLSQPKPGYKPGEEPVSA